MTPLALDASACVLASRKDRFAKQPGMPAFKTKKKRALLAKAGSLIKTTTAVANRDSYETDLAISSASVPLAELAQKYQALIRELGGPGRKPAL